MNEQERKSAEDAGVRMIASFEFMVFLLGVVLLAVGCAIQWGWPIGVAIVGAALIGEMKLGD